MKAIRVSQSWAVPAATLMTAAVVVGSHWVVHEDVARSADSAATQQSPLSRYLGFGHFPEQEEKRYAAEEQQRQRIIADCMAGEGFAYWPADSDILITPAMSEEDIDQELLRIENNPNRAYAEQLGDDDRAQYEQALYGFGGSGEGLGDEVLARYDDNHDGLITGQENWDRGCIGTSSAAVPGVFMAAKLLSDQLEEMNAKLHRTATYRAAETGWARCMNRSGFSGDSRVEIYRSVEAVPGQQISESRRSEFAKIQADCSHILDQAEAELRPALERQLVEDNQTVLERWGVEVPD